MLQNSDPPAKSSLGFVPDWRIPEQIGAFITYRHGGESDGPYDSFNLGDHVGDNEQSVAGNRRQLIAALELPQSPNWLQQVHGRNVFDAHSATKNPPADAVYGNQQNTVCAILTADCLPILLCSNDGLELAAVHAGWKGLLAGVISTTVEKFHAPHREITAYIGPAISATHYQVGLELRDEFISINRNYEIAFHEGQEKSAGRAYLDLAKIATMQLEHAGLINVTNSCLCTYQQSDRFYSYRRDGVCGRFASLIWRNA